MRGHTFRPFGGDHVAVLTGEDSGHATSCFADDVVVDFPSMAPAVERMQTAFVEDQRPEALGAAIRLSLHQAREGVTLPLQVPVRCTCRHCGGRGGTWTDSCLRCAGTGSEVFRHRVQVTVPAGVEHGTRFQFTVTPRHNPPTRVELQIVLA